MLQASYAQLVIFVSILWILARLFVNIRQKSISWKRELQLLLVYVCIVVVLRFTCFPFSKVDGKVQPMFLDLTHQNPIRFNLLPLVYLTDYPTRSEILLNIIGNTAMFLPIGIVLPIVYKGLNTHLKAIAAGIGFSLCIEIFQLWIFDRVSDVDDLILNSLGYLAGYGILLLVRTIKGKAQ
jgi:glycopeptide antibiotics resistance protein